MWFFYPNPIELLVYRSLTVYYFRNIEIFERILQNKNHKIFISHRQRNTGQGNWMKMAFLNC